jgi:predicted RNase H-like HicB family nuclease
MKLLVEIEKEEDGRWLAEVPELPGVMAYGKTSAEAMGKAQALALRGIAERIEHGEEA